MFISRCRRLSSSCISLRSLRSSAPKGSSSNRISGSLTRLRAMATRCCWPPDIWLMLRRSKPFRPTTSSMLRTLRRMVSSSIFFRRRPKATFSNTFRCGNSAYFWNTVFTGRLLQKACDQAKGGGFAAAGGAQQRHKLFVMDVEVQPIQNALTIKFHHDIPQ